MESFPTICQTWNVNIKQILSKHIEWKIYFVAEDQEVIEQSMKRIVEDTATSNGGDPKPCITFVPRSSDDETYITFQYGASGDCSAVC